MQDVATRCGVSDDWNGLHHAWFNDAYTYRGTWVNNLVFIHRQGGGGPEGTDIDAMTPSDDSHALMKTMHFTGTGWRASHPVMRTFPNAAKQSCKEQRNTCVSTSRMRSSTTPRRPRTWRCSCRMTRGEGGRVRRASRRAPLGRLLGARYLGFRSVTTFTAFETWLK